MPKPHVVVTKTYQATLIRNQKDFITLHRNDEYKKEKIVFDAFGPLWVFIFPESQDALLIRLRNQKMYFEFKPKQGILIPPYTIVEWKIRPGKFKWSAFSSYKKLDSDMPKVPVIYTWNPDLKPDNLQFFYDTLKNQKEILRLSAPRTSSHWAPLLKDEIDKNFMTSCLIQNFAKKNQISRTSLVRSFQNNYGFKPVEYRIRLRIFEACRIFLEGGNVTEAMLNSGFKDPSQFFMNFKNVLNTEPSKYQI